MRLSSASSRLIVVFSLAAMILVFSAIKFIPAARAGSGKKPIMSYEDAAGRSWLKLQEGRDLEAQDPLDTRLGRGLISQQSRPVSLATGDLDLDGFPDLVVGNSGGAGGTLTVRFGNPASFAPTGPETLPAIAEGIFPDPFQPGSTSVGVGETPDLVFTGDYNRDAKQDIIAAARGSSTVFLLAGDGIGGFEAPAPLILPGKLTEIASGQADRGDNYADLAIGTEDGSLLIYAGVQSILEAVPAQYHLPAAPASISLGKLDNDGAPDLAVAAGGRLFILHGAEERSQTNGSFPSDGLEPVHLPFEVRSLVLGEFIRDREARTEIASLADDGKTWILAQGELDTRPFTPEEILAQRHVMAEVRNGTRPASDPLPRGAERPRSWIVAEEVAGAPAIALVKARVSAQPADDLVQIGAADHQIRISNKGLDGRNAAGIDSIDDPIAVLPMRLNVMAQPGLVILQKGRTEPTMIMAAPQATFNVSSAGDTSDPTPDGTNNSGTLREAVQEANGNGTGADLITFSAGINPVLTITGTDNAAAMGDLDVNGSLTVMGNGSGSTLIDTNYVSGCGDCKVFGVNQDGTFSGIAVSFTGVTIQDGFNTRPAVGDFQETGGGIDFFLTGTGHAYSITNSVVTSNEARTQTQSYGGGVNIDSGAPNLATNHGTVTFTGSTFSNNTSDSVGGGINNFEDKHTLLIIGCTISGNTTLAPGGLGAQGGGISIRSTNGGVVTIQSSTTISNNSAKGNGGGLNFVGSPTSIILTISDTLITNNTSLNNLLTESAGGGMSLGGPVTMTNVDVVSNHSDTPGTGGNAPLGGGIFTNGGTISMDSASSITNNTCSGTGGKGGGVTIYGGTLNLNGVTVSGNSAAAFGGGFFVDGTDPSPNNPQLNMTNGSISTNSAASGGAIATDTISTSAVTLTGVSITSNTATTDTGGVLQRGGAANTMSINGVTFIGNTSPSIKTTSGAMSTVNTVNVDNGVTIAGGTFNAGSSTVNVGGNFAYTSGTFNSNTGTFNFNGAGAQSISAGSLITFNNLSDANVAQPLTFNNSINVNGSLTANGASTTLAPVAAAVIGGSGTLTGTGVVRVTRATGANDFLTQYTITNKTLTSLTVDFVGAVAQGVSAATYNNLRLNNASGAALSGAVSVNGTLTLQAGNLGVGTNTLTLNGPFVSTGGTFSSSATGTVSYAQGTNGQVVLSGSYGNLTFNNTNKDLTNANINIAGVFTPGSGTPTTTNSTITFNGTAAQSVPLFNYNNLTLNNAAGTTGAAGLTVNGLLRVQSGTFSSASTYNNVQIDAGATLSAAGPVAVAGNWTNGGGFLHNNFGVTFNGAGAQTITTGGSGAGKTFSAFTINKSGGTATLGGPLSAASFTLTAGTFDTSAASSFAVTTSGDLTISAGTFLANASTISVGGNWSNGGTFSPGTSSVTFNGAGAQTITTGGSGAGKSFSAFTINKSGGTATLGGALGAASFTLTAGTFDTSAASSFAVSTGGDLTISSGTFAANASAITVGGNWSNSGAFTQGTSTVSFTGGAQTIGGATPPTFDGLTVNNTGLALTTNTTVNGLLTLTNGEVNTGAATLFIGPAGTVARTNGLVIGTMQKAFSAPGAYNFPVGTAGAYSPVDVTVTAGSGSLAVKANAGTAPATPPIADATSLDRYWTLTETGALTTNVLFTYLAADVDGNENNYRVMRVLGSGVAYSVPNGAPCPGAGNPCVDPVAHTIKINGLSEFSLWTAGEIAPTAAAASIGGRVLSSNGQGLSKAEVILTDDGGNSRRAMTNPFGFYVFTDIPVGQSYIVGVSDKRFTFAPRAVTVNSDLTDINFVPIE